MTDTYLRVWEDNGIVCVLPEREASIRLAVDAYLLYGVDALLEMETVAGERYVTRASRIISWIVSTAESRARTVQLEKLAMDEERANRLAAGLPWDLES